MALYALLKHGFAVALQLPESVASQALSLADIWVGIIVILLFVISYLLDRFAHKPFIQTISAQLFAGLYLDEWFTRITLKIWAANLPRAGRTNNQMYISQNAEANGENRV